MKSIPATLLAISLLSCGTSSALAEDILPKHITPQAQVAIKKGLDFLAKSHSEDGSFSGGQDGQAYPVAMTALAGMAFLANGNTPSRGPYADHVAKIVEYLTSNAQSSGLITGPTQEQGFSMYGHGFSLMFLSSCYGMETNDRMRERMKKIINNGIRLTASASSNGGWCYTPGTGDEGSVTVTQIQGLRAASNAGFTVPKGAIEGGVHYLEMCQAPEGGICYSLGSVGTGAHTPISAAAIATLYNAGQYDSKLADSCLAYVSKQFDLHKDSFQRGGNYGHAYYTHLYAAQAFYQAGDKYWDNYFPGARDQLIKMQSGDGSWPGDGIGQTYGTSIALVILQLPYKYLPIYQHRGVSVTTEIETEDLAGLERLRSARDSIRQQMAGTIVGQEDVVEQLLVCLFARGHCILEGVPGLAKTLMIRTLAQCLSLDFNRIQFTPDLMPSDITGTDVMYEDRGSGDRTFKFIRGPIFANVLLADEINRTPPKTQAALLEGMAERQVSVGGERHHLPDPFFVLATQNPIEQEGTYPLPEAQLDRFLMKVLVRYPSEVEERSIYRLTSTGEPVAPTQVLSGDEMLALQRIVHKVPVSDYCVNYVANLVRSTRAGDAKAPRFIKDWVLWGVGPRGGQSLIAAAQARAALDGRPEVDVSDIHAMVGAVLRHRIVLNYNAEAQGQTAETVIQKLVDAIPLDRAAEQAHERIGHVLKA